MNRGRHSDYRSEQVGYVDDYMAQIENAEKMGGRDRLVVGKHRLALLSFDRRKNQKTKDHRLQASFEVVSSDVYQPGAKVSTAFFIERSDFPEYESSRAQDFIAACAACVGDTRGVGPLGGEMLREEQRGRGIVIDVTVTPDLDSDGQPKKGKKGNVYTSETWAPIQQTWEQVAEARADLDKVHGQYKPEGANRQGTQRQQTQQWSEPQGQQTQTQQATQPQGWGSQQNQPQGGQTQGGGGSLLRRR